MQGIARGIITLRRPLPSPLCPAVGHEAWQRIMAIKQYLAEAIEELIAGPIILSHALKEAVLVPHKHEDLELTLGSDLAIGYETHTASQVRLFITETFTFRILEPAIIVRYTV